MAQLPSYLRPQRWKDTETPKTPTGRDLIVGGSHPEPLSAEARSGYAALARLAQNRESAELELYDLRRESREREAKLRDDILWERYQRTHA